VTPPPSGPRADPAVAHAVGRLLGRTAKFVRAWGDRLLEPLDATVSDWIVLQQVAAAEAPGLSQIDLARFSDMGGPAMVRHVDRLEAAGVVDRRRDPDDRRVTRVTLTAAGHERYDELRAVMADADAQLRARLSATEQRTLERALDKLFGFVMAELYEEEQS
jgi:MarR family transcriptional regulator for hemolysin